MTTQYDFTNSEWNDIAVLPVLVGYAVAKAEDSGFVGSYREIRTLAHSIAAEAPAGPARGLIEAASTVDVKDNLDQFEQHDDEIIADVAVSACHEIARVLDGHADPAEAEGYKQWVHGIGLHVAEAAKEHGVRVSEPEAALLARVSQALGIS